MAWNKLYKFMCARDTKLADEVIGVPRHVIAMVEENCKVVFPQLYVDFLMSVGEEPGRYTPFSYGHDTDFYELTKLLPNVRYPNHKYWRITRHIDTSVDVHEEIFLDLTRENGDDTPLVTFDVGFPFQPDLPEDLYLTLKEALTQGAFFTFEINPKLKQGWIMCSTQDEEVSFLALRDAAKERLAEMGLKELLSPTERILCFGDEVRAAEIELDDEMEIVSVFLAANNEVEFGLMVELLLAALPGAELVKPRTRI